MWSATDFQSPRGNREILAAEVGPEFFNVLGVGPSQGKVLDGPETFVASYDFCESRLRGNPAAIGQSYEIVGRPRRLSGALPRGFSVLFAAFSRSISRPPEPTRAAGP